MAVKVVKDIEIDQFKVSSPYNAEFVRDAKNVGGKWDRDMHTWNFPLDSETVMNGILYKHYAYLPNDSGATVKVRFRAVDFDEGDIVFGNVVIATRPGRDSHVRLVDGASVVAGEFSDRGGSMKYPCVEPDNDVVLTATLSKSAVDAMVADGTIKAEKFEILDPVKLDREKLLAEKAKLLARLDEINAQLAGD